MFAWLTILQLAYWNTFCLATNVKQEKIFWQCHGCENRCSVSAKYFTLKERLKWSSNEQLEPQACYSMEQWNRTKLSISESRVYSNKNKLSFQLLEKMQSTNWVKIIFLRRLLFKSKDTYYYNNLFYILIPL